MAHLNATATPPPATKARQPEQTATGTDANAKQQNWIQLGILAGVIGIFLLVGGVVAVNIIGNVHQSLIKKAADEESKRQLDLLESRYPGYKHQ